MSSKERERRKREIETANGDLIVSRDDSRDSSHPNGTAPQLNATIQLEREFG